MYISIGKNLKLESTNDQKISKFVRDYSEIHDMVEEKYPDTTQPIILKDLLESLMESFVISWDNLPTGATFVWTSGGETLPNPYTARNGQEISYILTYSDGSVCTGKFTVDGDYTLDLSTLEPNSFLVTLTSDKQLTQATITRYKGTPEQQSYLVTTFDNNSYSFYAIKNENIDIAPYASNYSYSDRTLDNINGHVYSYTVTQTTTCNATFNYEAWVSLDIRLLDENQHVVSDITPYKNDITFTGDTNYFDYKKDEYSSGFVVWGKKNISISWNLNISDYEPMSDSMTLVNKNNTYYHEMIPMCTYTIVPNPSAATVTMTASGYNTVSGVGPQSITVAKGTTVVYLLQCVGYEDLPGSTQVNSTFSDTIPMTPDGTHEINITDYEYTNINEHLELNKYIGSDANVTIPNV